MALALVIRGCGRGNADADLPPPPVRRPSPGGLAAPEAASGNRQRGRMGPDAHPGRALQALPPLGPGGTAPAGSVTTRRRRYRRSRAFPGARSSRDGAGGKRDGLVILVFATLLGDDLLQPDRRLQRHHPDHRQIRGAVAANGGRLALPDAVLHAHERTTGTGRPT